MQRKLNHIMAVLLILSVSSSLVYRETSLPEIDEGIFPPKINTPLLENYDEDISDSSIMKGKKPDGVLDSTVIEGDYTLAGYFVHDQFVDLDDDGNVYIIEDYSDMKNKATTTVQKTFVMRKTSIFSTNWPEQSDTYYSLKESFYPNTRSSMFSPVFAEASVIQGKIHVLSHFATQYSDIFNYTIKVCVSIFNPSTGNLTEIALHEEILPDNLNDVNQKIFELTLNQTYSIPIGNRLKLTFEGKVSSTLVEASIELDSSKKGSGSYSWDITDGVYSNSYSFGGYNRILGMQIYYKSATYPEITVTGITNSTYYFEEKDIDIFVSGATSSSYRWDLDGYTTFDDSVSTTLPTSEGWHFLEVRASDSFNNTAIEVYDIGYDPTEGYVVLNDPTNNSVIHSGSILNFTTYGANSITCEWDENGTEIDLLSIPGYDLAVPLSEGCHNLSLSFNDTFVFEDYFYVFSVDASAPQISLVNLLNDTLQPSGKLLEISITDYSTEVDVNYKWDDNIFLPWTPSEGTIYRTYLPETVGYHNLTITAEDQFGFLNTKFYRFNVSTDALLVELRTMTNESWYFGGDTVEVTISGTNDTLVFSWDGNSFQDGTPYLVGGTILTLDGANSLPVEISSYHYLTIIVGSIDDLEYTFVYEFRIDTESPNIDSSILDYHNERFKNTETLTFTFSDNATLVEDLLVLISIDGASSVTLNYQYELALSLLVDGVHNFTIYVYDSAGNVASQFIIFTVDSIAPTVDILSFDGLVTLPDTTNYVPYGSTILISISDADTIFSATYSWDGSAYQSFTDTIVLDYSDGFGLLIINASDSIGNERIITYELTIDSQSPEVILLFPFEFSTINEYTNLIFNIEDGLPSTISFVEFYWDILPTFSPEIIPDSNGDFEAVYLPLYSTEDIAVLSIYAEDIVGNNHTYQFSFVVDITPPDATLYIYDGEVGEYVDASTFDFIRGGTELWYDNSTSYDLSIFIYSWDNNDSVTLDDPWLIFAPTQDGEHNLTITLRDNTGESSSPNEIQVVFYFAIDDIGIEVVEPSNLLDETQNIIYKESLIFTIKVYDTLDNLTVSNLVWHESELNNLLNLDISNTTLDPITFSFTITATNVGNTSLDFIFSSDYSNNHTITINLFISKKEGNLRILDTSDTNCIYEESVSIDINLQDELSVDQEITSITVDGLSVDFWLDANYIYQFEISSILFGSKGNHSLNIVVESDYYFGETNDSYTFILEIDPIPLVLSIEVSGFEIVEGSTVVVTATLTYLNGTVVEGSEISFTIYIYYKSGQGTVDASIEGYDDYIVLSDITGPEGKASVDYLLSEEIDYIAISASYEGSDILSDLTFEFEEIVRTIQAGLSPTILYSIIGASLVILALVSFIIYKTVKRKPFEKYLGKVSPQDLIMKLNEICPGTILSIFDQKKGPIPLYTEHSFDYDYGGRFTVGTENFVLKICDQAYSTLGFEDVHQGRKTSVINLPNEGLVGFVHAIQLKNVKARGGHENLSIIIVTQVDYGNYLLAFSEFIYKEIDELISRLESKKPLSEIKEQIFTIRQRSAQVILAAIEENK